jgi:glycerophosphoryl diester phosphodiesterase
MNAQIPLLTELIDSVQQFTRIKGLPDVYFLLEIKANPKTDGTEQPAPQAYVDLILKALEPYHLGKQLLIQSFDMRPLQVIHERRPDIILGFLTDNRNATVDQNLELLKFKPFFYNPHYKMVTPELLKKCHDMGMKVVPWTVNTKPEMDTLVSMGVDGIITDYPDMF